MSLAIGTTKYGNGKGSLFSLEGEKVTTKPTCRYFANISAYTIPAYVKEFRVQIVRLKTER